MNQAGKSRLRKEVGVFLHQIHVFQIGHLLIIGRWKQLLDIYF
jgi:hypothetical protein